MFSSSLNSPIETIPFFDAYYSKKKIEDDKMVMVKSLIKIIIAYANSESPIKEYVNGQLDVLFEYRANALKWLKDTKEQINFDKDFEPVFELSSEKPSYNNLYDSIRFALRTNRRAINLVVPDQQIMSDNTTINFENIQLLGVTNFKNFLMLMTQALGSAEIGSVTNLFINSLYLEFGIIATVVIAHEDVNMPQSKIDELAGFVAKSAQEFGATIKILYPKSRKNIEKPSQITPEMILEQKYIAEQDIENYLTRYEA